MLRENILAQNNWENYFEMKENDLSDENIISPKFSQNNSHGLNNYATDEYILEVDDEGVSKFRPLNHSLVESSSMDDDNIINHTNSMHDNPVEVTVSDDNNSNDNDISNNVSNNDISNHGNHNNNDNENYNDENDENSQRHNSDNESISHQINDNMIDDEEENDHANISIHDDIAENDNNYNDNINIMNNMDGMDNNSTDDNNDNQFIEDSSNSVYYKDKDDNFVSIPLHSPALISENKNEEFVLDLPRSVSKSNIRNQDDILKLLSNEKSLIDTKRLEQQVI